MSVIFLIELSLFCFLDQYLVMVLAGANFMFQFQSPCIESRCVPPSRIKLSSALLILNPLILLISRFFYPAMHHNLLFHFHHMNIFYSLLFFWLWTSFSLGFHWCSQSNSVFLLYYFHWQLSLVHSSVIWGEIRLLMPISHSAQEIRHSSNKYLTNLSPSHKYLSETL